MAWHTDNILKNAAVTDTQAPISKNIINRNPNCMIIEVFTTTQIAAADIYLEDSADGENWSQVATTSYDTAESLTWRVDARTTPIRTQCRVSMKTDSGTATVSKLMVTWES